MSEIRVMWDEKEGKNTECGQGCCFGQVNQGRPF